MQNIIALLVMYLVVHCTGSGWDEVYKVFIAAPVVLCFAFEAKTVLVAHQCFGYCRIVLAQCQGFLSVFSSLPKLGRDTARTVKPNRPKGFSIVYDLIRSNKSSEKGRGRVDVSCYLF